jgi:hypothetical protein
LPFKLNLQRYIMGPSAGELLGECVLAMVGGWAVHDRVESYTLHLVDDP